MLINDSGYFKALMDIKTAIREAQYRAVLGANREQIILFWNIGRVIIENSHYGSRFIENLARDIKLDFPGAKGYSVRNLRYMKKFAELVQDESKVPTVSALLTWSHSGTSTNRSALASTSCRTSCRRSWRTRCPPSRISRNG